MVCAERPDSCWSFDSQTYAEVERRGDDRADTGESLPAVLSGLPVLPLRSWVRTVAVRIDTETAWRGVVGEYQSSVHRSHEGAGRGG